MLSKYQLSLLYVGKEYSVPRIAKTLSTSEGKINYWLKKHGIRKRNISEALYRSHNPNGDPYKFVPARTSEEAFLDGLGLGLFWGEGTKANMNSIRLGNTDPSLIRAFMKFLEERYTVPKSKFRFGLQIFYDHASSRKLVSWWARNLGVKTTQFFSPVITPSVSGGTYKKKAEHGVLTVYVSNTKLRGEIGNRIEKLRSIYYDSGAH